MKVIKKIEQWGKDRGFYNEGGATIEDQYTKLLEEVGELAKNLVRGNSIIDDAGDTGVVLIILNRLYGNSTDILERHLKGIDVIEDDPFLQLCEKLGTLANKIRWGNDVNEHLFALALCCLKGIAEEQGLTLKDCLKHAYNEIKDRKGQWRNGTFVKEEDL